MGSVFVRSSPFSDTNNPMGQPHTFTSSAAMNLHQALQAAQNQLAQSLYGQMQTYSTITERLKMALELQYYDGAASMNLYSFQEVEAQLQTLKVAVICAT